MQLVTVLLPGAQLVPPSHAQLLDSLSISAVLVVVSIRLGDHLKCLSAHDALAVGSVLSMFFMFYN